MEVRLRIATGEASPVRAGRQAAKFVSEAFWRVPFREEPKPGGHTALCEPGVEPLSRLLSWNDGCFNSMNELCVEVIRVGSLDVIDYSRVKVPTVESDSLQQCITGRPKARANPAS
jgi:hypothetical protein